MSSNSSKVSQNVDEDEQSIISTLPKERAWGSSNSPWLYQYQGFWYYPSTLEGLLSNDSRWNLAPSDILLCTNPKCGTTWLKALAFAILTRNNYQPPQQTPLLTTSPHDLVPYLESPKHNSNLFPLFSTHICYNSLPKSVSDCSCKIVYVCRDPKDVFVSRWHFENKMKANKSSLEPVPLDRAFEFFCHGIMAFGPYWDHALGYWKASLDNPDRVLFLKYEDIMRDPTSQVIVLANFMGLPFSNKEQIEGVPLEIINMCSFESLSSLEVNKSGTRTALSWGALTNDRHFRKGKVGDWRNYLTQDMADKIDDISESKFSPFGLHM